MGICKTSVDTGNGYSFVQITDTETSLYGDWIDNLKEYVKTNPTAFIIHTGDICYEAHQDFHGRYLRSVDLGIPTYYCVGIMICVPENTVKSCGKVILVLHGIRLMSVMYIM